MGHDGASVRRGELRTSLAGLATEPFAQIAQVGLATDAIDESGGTAALRLAENNDEVTYTTLGVRAVQTFAGGRQLERNRSRHRGMAARLWRSPAADDERQSAIARHSSSQARPLRPDALLVDAGIDVDVADNVTLRFNYSGQVAPAAMENGGWGNLALRF